ncbi:ABC transporter ATP-binding protein, partial [Stenotrophomonas sp. MB339]
MSTPSAALDGIATRPAPAPALKIVPARHPLQVFGTVLPQALMMIGLESVLGKRGWAWGTLVKRLLATPRLEVLRLTHLLPCLRTGLADPRCHLLASVRRHDQPIAR